MSSDSLTLSVGAGRSESFCLKLRGTLSHACVQYCEIHTSGNLASPGFLRPFPVMGFLLFGALSAEWSNPSITLKLETDITTLLSSFTVSFSSGKTAITTKTSSSCWKTPGKLLRFSVTKLFYSLLQIGPAKFLQLSQFTTTYITSISFLLNTWLDLVQIRWRQQL